ncbi:MAG: hypothetical protein AAGB13_03570 [Cyanobacteria bacterium P01_F01_bin.33]
MNGTIAALVDQILRTKIMTRDQSLRLTDILRKCQCLRCEDLTALAELLDALTAKQILTYPDLCL